MASLKPAHYPVQDLERAFGGGLDFWLAFDATCAPEQSNGEMLAAMLKTGAISREQAIHYVATCWPELTPQQVEAAIDKAYKAAKLQ